MDAFTLNNQITLSEDTVQRFLYSAQRMPFVRRIAHYLLQLRSINHLSTANI